MSSQLAASVSPGPFLALTVLYIQTATMGYQLLAFHLSSAISLPGAGTITPLVCMVVNSSLLVSVVFGVKNQGELAKTAAGEVRSALKHAAERQDMPPPVLDRLEMTASGFFRLDRADFFQVIYNFFTICIILLQFRQGEK